MKVSSGATESSTSMNNVTIKWATMDLKSKCHALKFITDESLNLQHIEVMYHQEKF